MARKTNGTDETIADDKTEVAATEQSQVIDPIIFISRASNLIIESKTLVIGSDSSTKPIFKQYYFKSSGLVGIYVTIDEEEIKDLRKLQTTYSGYFHESDTIPTVYDSKVKQGIRNSGDVEIAPGVQLREQEPKDVKTIRDEAMRKAAEAKELRLKT